VSSGAFSLSQSSRSERPFLMSCHRSSEAMTYSPVGVANRLSSLRLSRF
jgi:hypothetical protein